MEGEVIVGDVRVHPVTVVASFGRRHPPAVLLIVILL
jgi:hypothetical protein